MEYRIKTIDELTLMDDYMFAQVMRDTRHLKPLLQFILQIPIAKIELIEPQKTEKEGYDSKGVRLDQHPSSRSRLQGAEKNLRYLHLQL